MSHTAERRKKASDMLSKHGYGKMAQLATTAVHEHEKSMHKGKKETKLKLADGGCAIGGKPHDRLDRKPRASGGRNKHHEPKVSVNVINAGSKQPVPMPMPPSAPPMGAKPPMPPPPPSQQRPPMPPQGMAPPPGAMPPPRPPGMMASGGRAKRAGGGPVRDKGNDIPHLEGGSGGGLGRLSKADHESKRHRA